MMITTQPCLPPVTVTVTALRGLYWTQSALDEFASVTASYGTGVDAEIMRAAHVQAIERKALTDHVSRNDVMTHFSEVVK